ncbi:putative ATP-dependent RNA helicase TDRD12 isoform X3 [Gouania willdenowi]|uniref:putative ATP-dependent RNA helicase TDRD12 isoform X3 n=1 Tax=Gouania willdenowi TaxID=441366 RepID=UPI001054164A|nr:putative ATP-dependent RNA helicase TDRD12 isoform X3 [Gouania willdenowi]
MFGISIVKVDNPSCLWGRGDTQTEPHYHNMLQMNLFYQDVTQDLQKLKPKTLVEGMVCVVYWPVKKSWCRAVVERIITDSVSCKARCLLVDYGERDIVPSDQICVAMEKFLALPFLVKRFQLANIKPMTLQVFFDEKKAVLTPSSQWDSSATLHLHKLLQVSTQTEAMLIESTPDSDSIELYVTLDGLKFCVNDDLVARKYAYYSSKAADSSFETEMDPVTIQSFSLISSEILTPELPHRDIESVAELITPSSVSLVSAQQHNNTRTYKRDLQSEFSAVRFPSNTISNKALEVSVAERRQIKAEEMKNNQTEHANEDTSSVLAQSAADKELSRGEMDLACSRLMEWLNLERLNVDTDADAADIVLPPNDPSKPIILVHSAFPVEPCSSLDDAPITDTLRRLLRRRQYASPTPSDCYSWSAVARGCHTVVISQNALEPLSYLAPLLTHILLNSITLHHSTSGPIAVLLCPGWEKVQAICDLLEMTKVAQALHPFSVDHGVIKDEAKQVKIPDNCLLLLTTPFSLVRLLSTHCFRFQRIYHMVLDEADRLLSVAPEQMATILQHFSKVISSENASCPQQLVVTAKKWSDHMEGLIVNHMPCPSIIISIPEEAALYANVQQVMVMTQQSNKISVLSGMLDLNPEVGQKTLIITNSCQEVEDVFKAVSSKSAFCLKTHEGLTHKFDFVIQQWRKDVGPSTHVVLVTTNECLKSLGIRDATCVVHYDFPSSPKLFGRRLFCMVENFRNLSEQELNKSTSKGIKSVLLISEKNAHHVVGVLRYLRRTSTPLPPQLLSFAEKLSSTREDLKTNRPLCSHLKSFGSCRDSYLCPDRHHFIPQLDSSVLPASGVIEVVPLYIKTASVFYGRILRKEDKDYDTMCSEMVSFYSDKKPGAKELLIDKLYAVQEEDSFYRVKILSVPDPGGRLFFSVLVRFIDVGKEKEVKSHQFLVLPECFHSLPAQAVELVVCRVKPADAETDWHPKVTRLISQKIRGLPHRAQAVLSLGNTVFLDPMVRVTTIPGLKTFINEYNVQLDILNSGMGVANPGHIDLLKTLCQETHQTSEESSSSLESRSEAEGEVLAEAFRAAVLCKITAQHSEPQALTPTATTTEESSNQTSPAAEVSALSFIHKFTAHHSEPVTTTTTTTTEESSNQTSPAAEVSALSFIPKFTAHHSEPVTTTTTTTTEESSKQTPPAAEVSALSFIHKEERPTHSQPAEQTHSLNPQVLWYQTSEAAIVTVKLRNPDCQSFHFTANRVIYSGIVKGRSYRANLDLHQSIVADHCSWEMKSNEPVLKLVKQQQTHWEKLVKNKNIFVSYDLEHITSDEDEKQKNNGLLFVENLGENHSFVLSDSDSD